MGRFIRQLPGWPVGTPLPSEGLFLFYDPTTDKEYALLPAQVGTGTTGGSAGSLSLARKIAAAAGGAQDVDLGAGASFILSVAVREADSKTFRLLCDEDEFTFSGTTLKLLEAAELQASDKLIIKFQVVSASTTPTTPGTGGGTGGGGTTPTNPTNPTTPGTTTLVAPTVTAGLNVLHVSFPAVTGATGYNILRASMAPGGTLGAFAQLTTVSVPTLDDDSVAGDDTGYRYQYQPLTSGGAGTVSEASATVIPFSRRYVGQGAGQLTTLDGATWQATVAGCNLLTQKPTTPASSSAHTLLVYADASLSTQLATYDYHPADDGRPCLVEYNGQTYPRTLTNGPIHL